jgi:D-sedoheptulose 7-phosphate isomerase
MDISKYFDVHIGLLRTIEKEHCKSIHLLAETITAALKSGGKLLVMGNGGSAADAQHFAAELVGRFRQERKAIAAIALTTDGVTMTSVGNDYGFDDIFSRQVEALAAPEDVVLGISTSGRSANVIKALHMANQLGCTTICLLGSDGGGMMAAADHSLVVPSSEVPHIQEAHITVIHILCAIIESAMTCQGQDAS